MGAWLLGSILVWFTTYQSVLTVDRILSTPPQQIQKELDDLGPEVARQILRHEAAQLNRRVNETWEILQLGLAGALLVTSVLTSSRSKTIVVCSTLMVILSLIMAFYLTPSMNALSRSFDFVPATAAQNEREAFQRLDVWHRVLGVLNTILALVVTGRLLFDFYEFGGKLIPELGEKKRRRRRRTSGLLPGRATPPSRATGASAEAQKQSSPDR